MWKIEKFLGCCDLEKALVILSWIGIVFNVFSIIGYILLIAMLSVSDCNSEQLHKFLEQTGLEQKECEFYLALGIVGAVIVIIFTIIGITISFLFIRGVHKRKHHLILPLSIILGVSAVLAGLSFFVSLFTLHIPTIISKLVYCAIAFYAFLCVFTVYENIRDEKFSTVEYHSK